MSKSTHATHGAAPAVATPPPVPTTTTVRIKPAPKFIWYIFWILLALFAFFIILGKTNRFQFVRNLWESTTSKKSSQPEVTTPTQEVMKDERDGKTDTKVNPNTYTLRVGDEPIEVEGKPGYNFSIDYVGIPSPFYFQPDGGEKVPVGEGYPSLDAGDNLSKFYLSAIEKEVKVKITFTKK